jgi:glycosyltransferase involved in cell wall biosynthesis
LRHVEAAASLLGSPFSRLSVVSDSADWVLDEEAAAIVGLARRLGLDAALDRGLAARAEQCRHYTSQFILLEERAFATRHRVSLDYLHGAPGSEPVFADLASALRRRRERLWRVRVSHTGMEQLAREAGIDAARVHRIPLGIELARFPHQTGETRRAARSRLGLPEAAAVVGSFQKDGVGWGEGLEPKPIKGPDVFLSVVELLRSRVPELWVLLTGPARGFVRNGLERLGIPYKHVLLERAEDVAACYRALDVYVVASREEGGPKAVLEAMASGVPLVTTRVGQAADLVQDGVNGLMREIEDAEGLAHATERILADAALRAALVAAGRGTAEANSYAAQLPAWQRFFDGYVERR